MKIPWKIIVGILALLFTLTRGVSYAAETLSMERCMEMAYANSPLLRSADERMAGAAARRVEARSGKLPRLTLSETVTRTDNPVYGFMTALNQRLFTPSMMANINDPGTATNYNTRIGLELALYTGGMVESGILAAINGRYAAWFELERTRHQIRFNVKTAYMRVILARSRISVVEKALDTVTEHARIAGDLFDVGMIVESDVLSAKVRVAEIEEMRLSAENDVKLARAALLMAMGVPQNKEFEVDDMELGQGAFVDDLDAYIQAALENRPDLLALTQAIEARTQGVNMAEAGRLPQLYLMGNYDLDNSSFVNNDGQSWFVGLSMKYNVSDGGGTRGRVGQARASLDDLKWQRELMRQGIELEVRQAFYNTQSAQKKIEVMQSAVAQAVESYRIVNNRYKSGLAINVQVLAAETALTEARLKYLSALFDYSVSLEQLALAVGKDSSE